MTVDFDTPAGARDVEDRRPLLFTPSSLRPSSGPLRGKDLLDRSKWSSTRLRRHPRKGEKTRQRASHCAFCG